MKLFRSGGPSPAIVVAVVALAFAVVGTAVAGTDGLSSKVTKSKVKKIAKKQANKQITKRAPGLSVANAVNADKADRANKATTADSATNATNANTIAYGMFEANGTLTSEDRTKNLVNSNVTNPSAGIYCFAGLSFTAESAMVSGDSGFGFDDTLASVRIATPAGSALGSCPADATVRVKTFDVSIPALANRAFLVWFQD